jgi:hypothetical protein
MFEGPERTSTDSQASRRPGIGAILVLLMLLGFFANAALFRVATDAAKHLPDHSDLSPLRGGHESGGLSTDAPSTARATFRPQRGAFLVPVGSFRSPGWMPHARSTPPGVPGRRCPAAGESA